MKAADFSGWRFVVSDFLLTMRTFLKVPQFFHRYELAKDLLRHKIILLALTVLGILLSFTFIKSLRDWVARFQADSILEVPAATFSTIQGVLDQNYNFFFQGSYKYLVLIVMELIIFQVALRTVEIVKGKKEKLTFGLFANAQIRMIKVSLINFLLENAFRVVAILLLGLVDLDVLEPGIVFAIQCFFLGHTIIDNYNEIQRLSIRDSYHFTKFFPGVALGIGTVLYLLLLIPIVGPLVGPLVACIAATLCMHKLDVDPERASIIGSYEQKELV